MPIEKVDSLENEEQDFEDSADDDLVAVSDDSISEILISEILWEVSLVDDSADEEGEKALSDEKIFKLL